MDSATRPQSLTPFGFRTGPTDIGLHPEQIETLVEIVERRLDGHSLEAICQQLAAQGRATKFGTQWAPGTVCQLLARLRPLLVEAVRDQSACEPFPRSHVSAIDGQGDADGPPSICSDAGHRADRSEGTRFRPEGNGTESTTNPQMERSPRHQFHKTQVHLDPLADELGLD